jgi:uncharacterized protein YciI
MHFIIHCLDYPGAVDRRLAHYEAHKTYLATPSVKIVISGPLLAPGTVQAFHDNDPFKAAEIWEKVSINPFLKRMDNRD